MQIEKINIIKLLIETEKLAIEKELEHSLESLDDYLERFLEARNYDILQAMDMIRNHVKWYNETVLPLRNLSSIDVLKCNPKVLKDHLPCWIQGYDKKDGPVLFSYWGNAKIHELMQKSEIESIDNVILYLIWINEQMIKILINQSLKCKKKVTQWTFVIDASNWNIGEMSKVSMNFAIKLAELSQNNYPGRLNRIFIINVPRMFSLFWSLFKNWLNKETQERIYIFAKKEIWEPLLKKYIHEDELPVNFGGINPLIEISTEPVEIINKVV
tara:strand:- start:840 stop:1652 length:813 start_codon:yes stop_codon:yes gene_type:complete